MTRWRKAVERLVHQNPWIRVFDDEVVGPLDQTSTHVRIETARPGRGVVLVVSSEDPEGVRLAIVRTFRYPLGRHQWGFPRGFSHGTDSLETARVETLEEIGDRLDDGRLIGSLTPDSGLMSTVVDVVAGRTMGRSSMPQDDEVGAIEWVVPAELRRRIRDGEVDDGFTLAALLLWELDRDDAS